MTSPTAGNSRILSENPTPYNFTGYLVDALSADGVWRPLEDDADEPRTFPTEEAARDLAAAWNRLGVQTRVYPLTGAPTGAELASMHAALDAVDPRPPLTDYAAWLAECAEAAPEVRAFERRRASLMKDLYGDIDEEAA